MKGLKSGVWPTMVTPFGIGGGIDYDALAGMVEWYIGRGVDGLFAVCQSSEMFYLSLEERVTLSKAVVDTVNGRVPVIASGHISDSIEDQAAEMAAVSGTGIVAAVLITNRFALQNEGDDVWKKNMERFLALVPAEIRFGLYECPYPYKRVMSPELLAWCAGVGRFDFLKDTCCDLGLIEKKLEAVAGTSIGLYNANGATLLESLRMGAAGYSGVMANFHPELYVKLTRDWRTMGADAEGLQDFLGAASLVERQLYPVNAKYHLSLEGLPVSTSCRRADDSGFIQSMRMEVEQLRRLAITTGEKYGV